MFDPNKLLDLGISGHELLRIRFDSSDASTVNRCLASKIYQSLYVLIPPLSFKKLFCDPLFMCSQTAVVISHCH